MHNSYLLTSQQDKTAGLPLLRVSSVGGPLYLCGAMSVKLFILASLVVATLLGYCSHNNNLSLHDFSRRRLNGGGHSYDFNQARELTIRLLSLIRSRYELHDSVGRNFFLTANNMGENTWDIMKYKFALKVLKKETFVMVFGGSSVTAAHDNYYNESYPAITQKRLSPILKVLGADLEARNIAQGANACLPYQLCYDSMGGLDPDWIGWEQSYNCGRDESVFELAGRIAGFSANKAVLYFSASGAWSPEKCSPSTDSVPYSSEEWTPEQANLTRWNPSLQDIIKEKSLLNNFHKAKPSSSRFSGVLEGSAYKAVSPHGFNVWESNSLCEYINKEGKHSTGCNGIDAAQQCKLKFMTHEAGMYGSGSYRGASWHPTRAFHMLRGESIAWLYGLVIFETIQMLEDGLKKAKSEELIAQYKAKLGILQPPLPKPSKCQKLMCDVRPTCYTDFRPHYEESLKLSKIIVGKTNWTYDPEVLGDWSIKYGYRDAKPIFIGTEKAGGEIHFQASIKHIGNMWVCGQISQSLLNVTFFLDANVKLPSNVSDYIPSSNRVEWKKKKFVGNECKELTGLPFGTHVITLATPQFHIHNKNHKSGLTHVITW